MKVPPAIEICGAIDPLVALTYLDVENTLRGIKTLTPFRGGDAFPSAFVRHRASSAG